MNTASTTARTIFSGSLNKTLLIALVAMFGVYSFFIARTVVAVNQRKDIRTDIRDLQAKVSDLEITYFNLTSGIDMAKASELGFVESSTTTFAYTGETAGGYGCHRTIKPSGFFAFMLK